MKYHPLTDIIFKGVPEYKDIQNFNFQSKVRADVDKIILEYLENARNGLEFIGYNKEDIDTFLELTQEKTLEEKIKDSLYGKQVLCREANLVDAHSMHELFVKNAYEIAQIAKEHYEDKE